VRRTRCRATRTPISPPFSVVVARSDRPPGRSRAGLAQLDRGGRGQAEHLGADADFDTAIGEPDQVAEALESLKREQAATDAALAAHPDLGERLGTRKIAVREVMVHRIEECARHCGHADPLRECIDGRTGQ
jgi:hypothetical protein